MGLLFHVYLISFLLRLLVQEGLAQHLLKAA